jgi:hypothetical protein
MAKHAQNTTKAFLKKCKGAKDGRDVRIYDSQATTCGPETGERTGRVRGAYETGNNTPILTAPHLDKKYITSR